MLSSRSSSSSHKTWPPLASHGGAGPGLSRRVPRRLIWLGLGSFLLFMMWRMTGQGDASWAELSRVEAAAEEGLIEILVKQKEAIEKDTTVEVSSDGNFNPRPITWLTLSYPQDLAGFADRFKVLGELDRYKAELNGSYSSLNATTRQLYSRSIDYHFEQLFATLFPFVSKSPKKPRTFAQLSARYTRPKGIMYATARRDGNPLFTTSQRLTKLSLDFHSIPCGNDQVSIACPPCSRTSQRRGRASQTHELTLTRPPLRSSNSPCTSSPPSSTFCTPNSPSQWCMLAATTFPSSAGPRSSRSRPTSTASTSSTSSTSSTPVSMAEDGLSRVSRRRTCVSLRLLTA